MLESSRTVDHVEAAHETARARVVDIERSLGEMPALRAERDRLLALLGTDITRPLDVAAWVRESHERVSRQLVVLGESEAGRRQAFTVAGAMVDYGRQAIARDLDLTAQQVQAIIDGRGAIWHL